MSADFAHPHWAFVWPAYGLALVMFAILAVSAWRRLDFWARKAREDQPRRAAAHPPAAAPPAPAEDEAA